MNKKLIFDVYKFFFFSLKLFVFGNLRRAVMLRSKRATVEWWNMSMSSVYWCRSFSRFPTLNFVRFLVNWISFIFVGELPWFLNYFLLWKFFMCSPMFINWFWWGKVNYYWSRFILTVAVLSKVSKSLGVFEGLQQCWKVK